MLSLYNLVFKTPTWSNYIHNCSRGPMSLRTNVESWWPYLVYLWNFYDLNLNFFHEEFFCGSTLKHISHNLGRVINIIIVHWLLSSSLLYNWKLGYFYIETLTNYFERFALLFFKSRVIISTPSVPWVVVYTLLN